ncbi:hypothetical protein HKX48_001541 [Thoreauomyces humboldtii]|nr:hypothetical protein HKX48_001541 [Thoreauomyces humboldtii]
MSLVPLDYGSSSDEDEPTSAASASTATAKPPTPRSALLSALPTVSTKASSLQPPPSSSSAAPSRPSLFATLPVPKSQAQPASLQPPRKKVKIFVDLPSEEPEATASPEPCVGAAQPSSLFARLPPPKTKAAVAGRRLATGPAVIVPTAFTRKPKVSPAKANAKPAIQELEVGTEPESDSFFTLDTPAFGKDDESDAPTVAGPPAEHIAYQPSASSQYAYSESAQYAYAAQQGAQYEMRPAAQYAYSQHYEQQQPQMSDPMGNLPESAMRALGGRGVDGGAYQIKDVSQSSLVDSEWKLDPNRPQPSAGPKVAKSAKRKNNIMSLAADARARSDTINDAAASRMASQREARAKYGF